MPAQSLHHIGYVIPSIANAVEQWRLTTEALVVSQRYEDPIQQVSVIFLELLPHGSTQIELVEPVGADSPVRKFLDHKGGGLHHLCFEVDDLEVQIQKMRALKATLIRKPEPAVAFGGRRIAWMFSREKLLIEYLERNL